MVSTSALVAEIAARIPDRAVRAGPERLAIAAVVAAIVERFQPERVVLYGSRAYGEPRPDSDIDLMVVMDSSLSSTQQMWQIRGAIEQPPGRPIDVKVRTPAQIRLGLAEGDFFIEDVMRQGVTLYVRGDLNQDEVPIGDAGGRRSVVRDVTQEWLNTAEEDLKFAQAIARRTETPLRMVCYHAQQAAEKYLKSLLQEQGVRFPRTHDLGQLAALSSSPVAGLSVLAGDLAWLTDFAVDVRAAVRAALDLPVHPAP